MKISWKGILEGVYNSIFISEQVEQVARVRDALCRQCPLNSDIQKKLGNYKTLRPDFHCTVCGCDLHLKTRALSQECPLGHWKAEMTQEDEYKLLEKIKKDGEQEAKSQ